MNVVVSTAPSPTQAEQVFKALRDEIMSHMLAPGSRIKINEVARQFDVSMGAVREALSRLTAEGMTTVEPQKGYSVTPISREELRELTDARIAIEQLCLRAAMARHDVEWEIALYAAHRRLDRLPETVPDQPPTLNDTWAAAHARFHNALVVGCANRCLLRVQTQLYDHSERYRRLSVPLRTGQRDVAAEHTGIVRAALGGDVEEACRLLQDHLQATANIVLASPLMLPGTSAPPRSADAGESHGSNW